MGFYAILIRSRTLVALGACSAVLFGGVASPAQAMLDDSDGGVANCGVARYLFTLMPTAAIVGVPVANSQIQVNATNTKIRATGVSGNEVCETYLFPVSQFQWSLISPQGQNGTILNPDSLAPNIRLAGPGTYRLQLVACPGTCSLTIQGRSKRAGPFRHDFPIAAAQDITVPPEYGPPDVLPVSPANPPLKTYTKSERSQKCNGGGGVKDPQWVTAEDFTGPASYTLLEGQVTWSKVADIDNPLNHDTQDFEWKNKPDLPYAGLPTNGAAEMKTEWESGRYPRIVNPTAGDRTSTFGFLIFDCGHAPFNNEIHPPIGVATHRPRPIHVPPSFRPTGFPNGFGQTVFVPGIASDLWFNRRSGETTRNCSRTGLHNPAKQITVTVQGQQRLVNRIGSCIREPHPLGRTFNYRIYLPRNPRLRALELGITNPPNVPLFVNVEKFSEGGSGPFPVTVLREVNGVSFLDVTIDLRGFSGETYGRRISAGWAYPSPDNWGLSRWRVLLDDMYIYDDAEPGFDDGDWRVFFNTNNRDQEWSKILDCDGCVDDDENRRLNLATGPGGTLGPDIAVFPDQPIYVHTVGYDDEVLADDLGSVTDRVPQRLGSYKTNASNGEAAYRLEYRIRPAGAVKPKLTREAGALFAAYTGRPNPNCQPIFAPFAAQRGPTGARAPFCAPAQQDTTLAMTRHPLNLDIKRPLRLSKVEFDEPMEEEEFALTGISTKELRSLINSLSKSERAKLFKEMRQVLDVPKRRRDMVHELVTSLDRSLSNRLFRQAVPSPLR